MPKFYIHCPDLYGVRERFDVVSESDAIEAATAEEAIQRWAQQEWPESHFTEEEVIVGEFGASVLAERVFVVKAKPIVTFDLAQRSATEERCAHGKAGGRCSICADSDLEVIS